MKYGPLGRSGLIVSRICLGGNSWGAKGRRGWGKFQNFTDEDLGQLGGNFRVGRMLASGDVRLVALYLIEQQPRHGYDLMQALSDRTGGTYTPSAGTIYPRLAKLEEEGLVTKTVDGRKTVYEITDAGRAEVAARAHELEGIEAGLADSVRLIADEVRGSVREAMRSLRADLAAARTQERESATAQGVSDDPRASSREQLHRADAAINEFRVRLRTDLRGHVARGGELAATMVDELTADLDRIARDVTRVLRG